jgi:AcrR family transcriptional regulator
MEVRFRETTLQRARENPESPEARILNAAQHLFALKGFKGTTTREIVEAAGVNIATLHYFWGTKEELWNAAHFNMHEQLSDFVAGLIAEVAQLKPREAFRTAVFKFYTMLMCNPDINMLREQARGTEIQDQWEKEDEKNFNLLVYFLDNSTKYRFDPVDTRFALACFFGALGYFLQPALIEKTFGVDPSEIPEEFRWKVTDSVCTMLDRFGRLEKADVPEDRV